MLLLTWIPLSTYCSSLLFAKNCILQTHFQNVWEGIQNYQKSNIFWVQKGKLKISILVQNCLEWFKNIVRWYLSEQHLFQRHFSISGIYQQLLTQFWPNCKGRFQKKFWLLIFGTRLFYLKLLYPKFVGLKMFLDSKVFLDPHFFEP